MPPPEQQPTPTPKASAGRSRVLAVLAVATGLLTAFLGLGLAGVGMGFANATASGTGVAAFGVGLWSTLACRGMRRRRLATLLGVSLAWAWLLGRLVTDWGATVGSAVVVLFLIPAVSVPLGVVWVLLALIFTSGLVWRTVRSLRQRPVEPGGASRRTLFRPGLSLGVRLTLLILITWGVPRVVWRHRGDLIRQLAQRYSTPPGHPGKPVEVGACSMVFLGYELTQHGAERAGDAEGRERLYARTLADAEAELGSIAAAGARYVRLGASGDQLLTPKPAQERMDDQYVAAARHASLGLVLVDTQHPQVLRNRRLDWPGFCRFQRQRIEYYQQRYRPEVYFVVCEPMTYHSFALTPEARFSAAAWATQLADMCRLVKSLSPATRTGICLLVMPDREPEWEVWSRLKTLPELDILSVEIYEPDNFAQTEERLRKYGHPRQSGKAFWIAETYNGWALCGQRRWDQDAAWLEVADAFARTVEAEAVLVWTFCAFVPGGNFLDFGTGRLRAHWGDGSALSTVGQAFRRLRARAP